MIDSSLLFFIQKDPKAYYVIIYTTEDVLGSYILTI